MIFFQVTTHARGVPKYIFIRLMLRIKYKLFLILGEYYAQKKSQESCVHKFSYLYEGMGNGKCSTTAGPYSEYLPRNLFLKKEMVDETFY